MSLYIFDKDKTLLRSVRSRLIIRRSPLKPKEQILRKGVFEKLADLRAAGHQIAIATNQIAVAHGIITLKEAEKLVENCADKIGGVSAWRLSTYDPRAKKQLHGKPNPYARYDETCKPHPGMILQIMEELGSSPKETFMVGDKIWIKRVPRQLGYVLSTKRSFLRPSRMQNLLQDLLKSLYVVVCCGGFIAVCTALVVVSRRSSVSRTWEPLAPVVNGTLQRKYMTAILQGRYQDHPVEATLLTGGAENPDIFQIRIGTVVRGGDWSVQYGSEELFGKDQWYLKASHPITAAAGSIRTSYRNAAMEQSSDDKLSE